MKRPLQCMLAGGIVVALVSAAGCGGGGGDGIIQPTTVASVVITSPATAPAFGALGRTVQFTAEPRDASGNVVTGKTIAWSSNNAAVASVNSSSGLVTAVGNGTATISASVDGKTGSLGVTVAQVTNSVAVTPSTAAFGAKGSTSQLTAQARDSTNNAITGKIFTWSSSSTAVATVDAAGLVTAVADGTTQVSATVDGNSDSTTVTVAIVTATVTVTPGTKTFGAAGGTQLFTAQAVDSNSNVVAGRTFAWSSTNTAVVTVDASSGLATSVANGTAQIQATADGKTGSASITVDIVIATLTLSPTARTFTRISQTQAFTPTARDSNNNVIAGPGVTWVSRNTAFVTVDASGVATSVADGATYVVATATSSGAKDSAQVTVAAVANGVSISPSSVAFGAINSTRQLSATVLDSGNTAIPGRTVTWSGTDRGTASVSASGLVRALAVGNNDTAIATPAGPADGNVGRAPISVTQVVFSITVTSAAGTAPDTLRTTGRTRQFNAAAADSNGNAIPGTTFTWSSTSTAVATVDAAGLITAVADGLTSVEATAGSPAVTGSRSLRVLRFASVFTLVPTSPPEITTSGGTQVFNGTAQDSSGANLLISWLSRSTSVATVSPATGTSTTATAVASGTTQIVISGGTRSDSASLTVNIAVSFSGQVQPIFTQSCALSGCHAAASPQEGMNLSLGAAYAAIVNVNSNQQPTLKRVLPGNPDLSYLIRKLEGGPNISLSRMPEGGPFLAQSTVNIIRNWITQGAPNN